MFLWADMLTPIFRFFAPKFKNGNFYFALLTILEEQDYRIAMTIILGGLSAVGEETKCL